MSGETHLTKMKTNVKTLWASLKEYFSDKWEGGMPVTPMSAALYNFEAELREKLKECSLYSFESTRLITKGIYKEILGDE